MEIVEFIKARLDEEAWWAREASRDGDDYTPTGEHWQWECDQHDEVIEPDPVAGEFMECPRGSVAMGLRSTEQYATNSSFTLPGFALKGVEELRPAVAGHIARHDPARVLREVEAKRRMLDEHTPRGKPEDGYGCPTCWVGAEDGYPADHPCPTLRLMALPDAAHPDYDPTWSPA